MIAGVLAFGGKYIYQQFIQDQFSPSTYPLATTHND